MFAYFWVHGAGGLFTATEGDTCVGIGEHVVRDPCAEDGLLLNNSVTLMFNTTSTALTLMNAGEGT